MTFTEFKRHFNTCLMQYETIDRKRVERYGPLIQGFIGIKSKDGARVIPFMISHQDEIEKAIQESYAMVKPWIESLSFVGVSFVQHYIHYSFEQKIVTP